MGKKRVMAFGTFDLLHQGHIYYLRTSSKYGKLYAVVARDETVKSVKGRKPFESEKTRLEKVSNLPFVFKSLLGYLNDKYRIIDEVKPDVICLGYDQNISIPELKSELRKRGIKTRIIRLKAYKPELYKTSRLMNRKISNIYLRDIKIDEQKNL